MDSIVESKSFDFAIKIIQTYKYLCADKKEYVMSKQLLRSGTSIGANICEAQQGQSKRDFLMKMNISLKEASETKYWLRLLTATGYLPEDIYKPIVNNCVELEKMLTKTVKTTSAKVSEK